MDSSKCLSLVSARKWSKPEWMIFQNELGKNAEADKLFIFDNFILNIYYKQWLNTLLQLCFPVDFLRDVVIARTNANLDLTINQELTMSEFCVFLCCIFIWLDTKVFQTSVNGGPLAGRWVQRCTFLAWIIWFLATCWGHHARIAIHQFA